MVNLGSGIMQVAANLNEEQRDTLILGMASQLRQRLRNYRESLRSSSGGLQALTEEQAERIDMISSALLFIDREYGLVDGVPQEGDVEGGENVNGEVADGEVADDDEEEVETPEPNGEEVEGEPEDVVGVVDLEGVVGIEGGVDGELVGPSNVDTTPTASEVDSSEQEEEEVAVEVSNGLDGVDVAPDEEPIQVTVENNRKRERENDSDSEERDAKRCASDNRRVVPGSIVAEKGGVDGGEEEEMGAGETANEDGAADEEETTRKRRRENDSDAEERDAKRSQITR